MGGGDGKQQRAKVKNCEWVRQEEEEREQGDGGKAC